MPFMPAEVVPAEGSNWRSRASCVRLPANAGRSGPRARSTARRRGRQHCGGYFLIPYPVFDLIEERPGKACQRLGIARQRPGQRHEVAPPSRDERDESRSVSQDLRPAPSQGNQFRHAQWMPTPPEGLLSLRGLTLLRSCPVPTTPWCRGDGDGAPPKCATRVPPGRGRGPHFGEETCPPA